MRKGRVDDAKAVLIRTASPGYWDTRNIDAYLAVIKHTDDIERAEAKSGSFWDLWRGSNLRRTEIQMGVWACQVWSGTAMTAYAVQFFKDAGMSTVTAFNLNIVVTSMNLVGCMIEMFLITRIGRRPLILGGLMILGLMLTLIGIFGSIKENQHTLQGIGACCAVINLVYHASVGPLTYTVAAEVPASRLRVRSVAWGRAFYSINYNATAQLTPRMVSAIDWNWGARASFFWLGGNLGVTAWAYFRLPETGGRSFTELDILFANKVSARKFKSTVVHGECHTVPYKPRTDDTLDEAAGNAKFAEADEVADDAEEKGNVTHLERTVVLT
jgi:SP family general alpha glucoside:H+ symporter-like MFS transporter